MYEYLTGTITQVFPAYIVVENNGIGYLINVANPFRFKTDETKQEKFICTRLSAKMKSRCTVFLISMKNSFFETDQRFRHRAEERTCDFSQ